MNKNIVLSIEQMMHLEELGLNTSDAHMYWNVFNKEGYYGELIDLRCWNLDGHVPNNPSKGFIPAYTLQDILCKLPPFIKNYDNLPNDSTRESRATKWLKLGRLSETVWYCLYDGDGYWQYFDATSPIDCAYQMLIWCIENGHITTNKKSKSN